MPDALPHLSYTDTYLSLSIIQLIFFLFFQFALCFVCCFSYYFTSLFCCNHSTCLCFFRCLCNCSCCLRSCLSCLCGNGIDRLCRFYCTPCSLVNSSSSFSNNTAFFQLSCCLADLS